jgi:hypothetical protein
MQTRIPLSLFALVFAAATALPQQPDADAAKLRDQRKAALVGRVVSDSEQLKLPENRAILNARLGVMAWRTDQERAKKLLQSSISELNAAQQEAESARGRSNLYQDLLNSQNLRPQILNTIASVDPEYALDSLYKTRPAAVAAALAGESSERINDQAQNRSYLAQAEMNLEQRLLRVVADKNPDRSAAILKETIRKRLSNETYESLKKLYLLDADAGLELADDVLRRLNSAAFISNSQPVYDLIQLSTSIISNHVRERQQDEKYLRFSDSGVRTLSIKLLNSYLDNSARIGYVPFEQLEPIAKRYAPNRVERLRKAAASGRYGWGGHGGGPTTPEYNDFLKTNPSADQLVQAAGRFSPELQRQMFLNAANKFSESGQYENAVVLLKDRFEGEALDNAIGSLNWYYAHLLMQKGDYDAAEAMMLEFGESNRISSLTSLAQNLYNKSPTENKARAAGILRRVRGMMPERPENYNEMSQLFALINAMTAIEPADAFTNIEPLIDPINGLVQAFAVVQGFQGGQLRQGEYQISNGMNFGINIDPTIFRNLATSDFDRTNAIIDSFARTELRISLRMYLAESLQN